MIKIFNPEIYLVFLKASGLYCSCLLHFSHRIHTYTGNITDTRFSGEDHGYLESSPQLFDLSFYCPVPVVVSACPITVAKSAPENITAILNADI